MFNYACIMTLTLEKWPRVKVWFLNNLAHNSVCRNIIIQVFAMVIDNHKAPRIIQKIFKTAPHNLKKINKKTSDTKQAHNGMYCSHGYYKQIFASLTKTTTTPVIYNKYFNPTTLCQYHPIGSTGKAEHMSLYIDMYHYTAAPTPSFKLNKLLQAD